MSSGEHLTEQQAITSLKVALRNIAGWEATQIQACRILRISPATYRRATRGFAAGQRLDQDQQQRIGLVLGNSRFSAGALLQLGECERL